jgi:hypothetical protein
MKRIARFIELLHQSRQVEAERVIRRCWHLVEEAHAHERRAEVEAKAARPHGERALEPAFMAG